MFRLGHNVSNLVAHFFTHVFESAFASNDLLVRHGTQFVELFESFGESFSHFGQQTFRLELVETLHDNVFRADVFNAHHIEKHIVAEVEGRVKRIRLAFENLLGHIRFQLLICHQNGDSFIVETSTARSSGHLNVLTPSDPSKFVAIKLLNRSEHDCLRRHVDSHGESLSCEQHFKQSVLEEQLYNFLNNWQQTAVMNANALFEERQNLGDLRQLLVFFTQRFHGTRENLVH